MSDDLARFVSATIRDKAIEDALEPSTQAQAVVHLFESRP